MPVFSRKKGEGIVIGNTFVVEVVQIRGDTVSLGIHAPRFEAASYQEAWEAIAREREARQRREESQRKRR